VAAVGSRVPPLRRHALKTVPNGPILGGIPVAVLPDVRPFFLAWLTLALLLFGLSRFTHAGDEMAIAGFVNATEQEAAEGYFAVGSDAMVVVKQGTGLQRWLKAHSGQRIRVTLEPAGAEN
jgi:hypothetical protein